MREVARALCALGSGLAEDNTGGGGRGGGDGRGAEEAEFGVGDGEETTSLGEGVGAVVGGGAGDEDWAGVELDGLVAAGASLDKELQRRSSAKKKRGREEEHTLTESVKWTCAHLVFIVSPIE